MMVYPLAGKPKVVILIQWDESEYRGVVTVTMNYLRLGYSYEE